MNDSGGGRTRALRLAAELAVIVGGVFLGLAADSWREGRAELRLEAVYLRALQADVAASIVGLDEAIDREGC